MLVIIFIARSGVRRASSSARAGFFGGGPCVVVEIPHYVLEAGVRARTKLFISPQREKARIYFQIKYLQLYESCGGGW
jgi:hypothetical protein